MFTEDEYQEYEESLKHYRDLKNSLDTAYDDGKSEGIAEGKAEGIINKARETAQKMKSKKYSIDEISDITGLSIEEIQKI